MKETRYWFPAKRYGWGWGLPSSWQGWVVMGSFMALLLLVAFGFPPSQEPKAFALCVALLCAALFAICFVQGEPPRWRWGKRARNLTPPSSGRLKGRFAPFAPPLMSNVR